MLDFSQTVLRFMNGAGVRVRLTYSCRWACIRFDRVLAWDKRSKRAHTNKACTEAETTSVHRARTMQACTETARVKIREKGLKDVPFSSLSAIRHVYVCW
jgi:hypothetical protein